MDEHSLHCCHLEKPTANAIVKLFFEDGPPMEGVWTGREWQVDRKRVSPVSWQPLHEKEMAN
jgi:hypothetical protein